MNLLAILKSSGHRMLPVNGESLEDVEEDLYLNRDQLVAITEFEDPEAGTQHYVLAMSNDLVVVAAVGTQLHTIIHGDSV